MSGQHDSGTRTIPSRIGRTVYRYRVSLLILVALLVVWEVYSQFFNPRGDVYFPSISYVVAQTIEYQDQVLLGIRETFLRVLIGYPVGVAMGITIGVLYSESRLIRQATLPVVVFMYSLPFVILAPLFVIWFGFGPMAIAMFVAVTCFYFVFINTLTGLTTMDEEYMHLATSMGATTSQRLLKIKLWVAMPEIASGTLVAAQQAFVSVIVAEFVIAGNGLGAILITGQSLLRIGLVFGVLIIIMLFALVGYGSVKYALGRIVPGDL